MSRNSRWDLGLTQVFEGLYVGPASYVTPDALASRKITTLVWATPEVDLPAIPEGIHLLKVLLSDDTDQDLSPFFPQVVEAFTRCRKEGTSMASVCRAGISRSSSLAIAALIGQSDLQEMSLRRAYDTVKGARPMIRPNVGFFSQLVAFERSVRPGAGSVEMAQSPYDPEERIPDVYLEEIGLSVGKGNPLAMFIPFSHKKS